MKRQIIFSLILLVVIFQTSCKKYVEVPMPPDLLLKPDVFREDKTATAAIAGIYSSMNGFSNAFANTFGNFLPAMSADEFYYSLASASFDAFKDNSLLPDESYLNTLWNQPYGFIYHCNAAIEGMSDATISAGMSTPVKNQLLGEAKFLRAFFHFYLVNYFGDVPLITSTDYRINTNLPRTAKDKVYGQIIADLKDAQQLMSDAYPTGERTRVNKAVATGLLARVYLYNGQWAAAEMEATTVINNTRYKLLTDLTKVFTRTSEEVLWQLQAVNTVTGAGGLNTWEGFSIVPAAAGGRSFYNLTNGLRDAFETGDRRKSSWTNTYVLNNVTYHYPFKYRNRTKIPIEEYSTIMRFAEQFLIRAEARVQLEKLDDARADLDTIRSRAGLDKLPTNLDKAALLLATEQERRVELFTEWGHRWLDLRRTGRADAVLSPIKPKWKSTSVLYPIPSAAIRTNTNLEQNEGYK